jgi:E-phenylitaconyl-CoA hydratase
MMIDVRRSGPVLTITLNRPERRNAVGPEDLRALADAWHTLDGDDQLRVALVTGSGRDAFCAGGDLRDLVPVLHEEGMIELLEAGLLVNPVPRKPVVAAVNGACLGGGLLLLLGTDVRLAVPTATFGTEAERRRGMFPVHAARRLFSEVPHAVACDLLLCGAPLDASEAARLGLLSRLVDHGDLLETAQQTAEVIAALDPVAVRILKRTSQVDRSSDDALAESMRRRTRVLLEASRMSSGLSLDLPAGSDQ